MITQDKEDKLIEMYVQIDDFCKSVVEFQLKNGLEPMRNKGQMSISEIMTILVYYQKSGY